MNLPFFGPRPVPWAQRLALVGVALLIACRAAAQPLHDFGLANNIRASSTVTTSYLVTNTVGTNVTYGVGITNAVADLSLYKDWSAVLAVQPLATNAGTETVTANFVRSNDNVIWETTPGFALGFTVDNTATKALFTNLSSYLSTANFVKLVNVTSTATNALTNCSLKISPKRARD